MIESILKTYQKQNAQYITPCFATFYFSGQFFRHKIIFELPNEYYDMKIPHITLFCVSTLKIWRGLKDRFEVFLWAKGQTNMPVNGNSKLVMLQIMKNLAKIFCKRNVLQNTVIPIWQKKWTAFNYFPKAPPSEVFCFVWQGSIYTSVYCNSKSRCLMMFFKNDVLENFDRVLSPFLWILQ